MTVHTSTHAPALDAYLRRATWGLPDSRRQELWDELEEHVLTRAHHLHLTGLSPQSALTQALRELGPPSRVTLGMAKVYSMPKLFLAAGTAALAFSAALHALAGGPEGPVAISVLTQGPIKPSCVRGTVPTGPDFTVVSRTGDVTCYTFKNLSAYSGVFLSGPDIQKAVNAQGGQAAITGRRLSIDLPGLTTGGGATYARFVKGGVPYYDAASMVGAMTTSLPVTLSGFGAPRVQIGNLTLQFGQTGAALGRAFYNPFAHHLVTQIIRQSSDAAPVRTVSGGWFSAAPGTKLSGPSHLIKTNLPAGEIVLLMTKRAGQNYMTDTAEVQQDGSVQLQSEANQVRFVTDPAQLGPYPSSGRVNALLVRISDIPLNRLSTGIFLPNQPTSTAR